MVVRSLLPLVSLLCVVVVRPAVGCFVSYEHLFCNRKKNVFVILHPETTTHRLKKRKSNNTRDDFRIAAATTEETTASSTTTSQQHLLWKDVWMVTRHLSLCFLCSALICAHQDYDVSSLNPSGHLRAVAMYGMGYGQNERLLQDEDSLRNIPSYNEVMQHHFQVRVAKYWKGNHATSVRDAVQSVSLALDSIDRLKALASDYQWDEMRSLIRKPVLTTELEQACAILRSTSSSLSVEARQEVGFDWGSCAWRHCGALADAQEALAELYNLLGVLEPFECKFCLDVVERSLRSILAVVPPEYASFSSTSPYQPYKVYEPMTQTSVLDLEDNGNQDESSSSLNMDYVNTMTELRNNF